MRGNGGVVVRGEGGGGWVLRDCGIVVHGGGRVVDGHGLLLGVGAERATGRRARRRVRRMVALRWRVGGFLG